MGTRRAQRGPDEEREELTPIYRASGGVKGREGVPKLIERAMVGEFDVEPFISHRISLDEVNRGFELMEAQDGIRSVIELG